MAFRLVATACVLKYERAKRATFEIENLCKLQIFASEGLRLPKIEVQNP